MDRFAAQLLLQRQLRKRESRQLARRVEAVMEALAQQAEADVESWATLGLLSCADVELAEHNELARGRLARELAEADGLDSARAATLERARTVAASEAAPLELALVLAEWLARAVARRDADDGVGADAGEGDAGEGGDGPAAASLARELELRCGRGDARGERIDQALEALSLGALAACELALTAIKATLEVRP